VFIPDNLSVDETTLIETVRRRHLARIDPTNERERQAALSQADQVAAEMIEATRAAQPVDDAPTEPLTAHELFWQSFRRDLATLDQSTGTLPDLMAMEEDDQSPGEWLPVRPPSPQSKP
jgi:hypothetical protein